MSNETNRTLLRKVGRNHFALQSDRRENAMRARSQALNLARIFAFGLPRLRNHSGALAADVNVRPLSNDVAVRSG